MQRVLVTGANRGIGLEFVRQFVERGARVFAACRKPGQATDLTRLALAHPGRLAVLPLDLAKPASIAELAQEVGMLTDELDLLVNNAGVLVSGERFGKLEAKNLAETFATNVIGPALLAQAMTPLLAAGSNPRVMNLSSTLGSIAQCDAWETPSYSISKAALNMATRQLSHELGGRGITAFVVNPGWVRTAMGGPRAQITTQQSVTGMLALLDRPGMKLHGRFLSLDGTDVPW